MKIEHAYTSIAERLAKSSGKSEKKIYKQLLGALKNLRERDLPLEQLRLLEEAIERFPMQDADLKELRKRSAAFQKFARKTLSLIPEGYYTALGLAFGVALSAPFGPILQRTTGMGLGISGTGLGVCLGLIAGYLVGSYLDVEAAKQNRVLKTCIR